MKEINIGLVGIGTVGGGVVKILHEQREFFRNRLGLPITLRRIADLNTARFSQIPVDEAICTASADDVLNDPAIDIVIELIGGTGFAKKLVLDALKRKKHVITANKALIAEFGPQLFEAAQKNGVSLYFEASVGGGMPSIKTIREALVGNEILSLKTIINGTCNYILTRMTRDKLPFDVALKQAQEQGYAEADPTLDVGGGDTGHKVAIMASLIYGGYVPYEKVSIEGITTIHKEDIANAHELGYCIKLLGVIKKNRQSGRIEVRVHPAMLALDHILASVSDVFNAILVEGDAVGKIVLYGRGAGEMPTASAVISDVVDVARNIVVQAPQRIPMDYYSVNSELPLHPIEDIESRYYLRFTVLDQPGVLARIATVLGSHGISIASVLQKECAVEGPVPVIILTHRAAEKEARTAIAEIEGLPFSKEKVQVIRIEE